MRSPALIEPALRQALHGPKRHDVQAALGWDDSQVSRFLSGGQGVVIDDELYAAVYAVADKPLRNGRSLRPTARKTVLLMMFGNVEMFLKTPRGYATIA